MSNAPRSAGASVPRSCRRCAGIGCIAPRATPLRSSRRWGACGSGCGWRGCWQRGWRPTPPCRRRSRRLRTLGLQMLGLRMLGLWRVGLRTLGLRTLGLWRVGLRARLGPSAFARVWRTMQPFSRPSPSRSCKARTARSIRLWRRWWRGRRCLSTRTRRRRSLRYWSARSCPRGRSTRKRWLCWPRLPRVTGSCAAPSLSGNRRSSGCRRSCALT
mmetsp:Transcript_45574/g.106557  ORF Transcript_45574/g.106557 Transcript_45574/m.106557 type:complete len:215 (-) Transcript_45574:1379-2023(-)